MPHVSDISPPSIPLPPKPPEPSINDLVHMGFDDSVHILISAVPTAQPELSDGIWHIIDQYGETHRIEQDGDFWMTTVA